MCISSSLVTVIIATTIDETGRSFNISLNDRSTEDTVKSRASARVAPLPETLSATLKAAKARQAADRLALGAAYDASGYVVVDEAHAPPPYRYPIDITAPTTPAASHRRNGSSRVRADSAIQFAWRSTAISTRAPMVVDSQMGMASGWCGSLTVAVQLIVRSPLQAV